jgi:hypothetical protein
MSPAYDAATGRQRGAGSPCRVIPPSPSRTRRWPRRQDVGSGRQILESGGRRHAVGHDDLRPRSEPHVHRHRQRLPVGAEQAKSRGRRQPLPRLDRRAQSRHREVRLALPGDAG